MRTGHILVIDHLNKPRLQEKEKRLIQGSLRLGLPGRCTEMLLSEYSPLAWEWMSPSSALGVGRRRVGRRPGGERSPGQNGKTEISAWQIACSAVKVISSSETEINIKLNLCASSPWVTSKPFLSQLQSLRPCQFHSGDLFCSLVGFFRVALPPQLCSRGRGTALEAAALYH